MLTNDEINRAIARQRGDPEVGGFAVDYGPPDYCKDWAEAGPLLGDLVGQPDTECIARAYHAAFCAG